jgi:hypothetical protein
MYKFNTYCQILPRTIVEFDGSLKVVQKMGKIEEGDETLERVSYV